MFMEVSFHCTPKELNKVELTMKFEKENAQMASCLNDFLDKRLFLKVRLKFEYPLAATWHTVWITFLALSMKIPDIESLLKKDILHTLWLIREVQMVGWINHLLNDSHTTIASEPAITELGLFSTRVHVHVRGQQGILRIS
jgi:hypothetical protein